MRALVGLMLATLTCLGCLDPRSGVTAFKDTVAPSVVQTSPAAGQTIPRNATISVTFSESMDPRSVATGIGVVRGSTEVPLIITLPAIDPTESAQVMDSAYTVMVKPASGTLDGSAAYTLVLRTLLTDLAGNPLPQEVRISFFTMQ